MKACVIESFGLEGLKIVDRPAPRCGGKDVLVAMKAVSLNYRDLLMIEGHYNPRLRLPVIPFSDGSGEVVAVGEDVTNFRPGDRVMTHCVQDWLSGRATLQLLKRTLGGPLDGALAEMALFPEHGLLKLPEHMDYFQGAALPCAALTAWSALITHGGLKPGERVLLLGTGGVSLFALQIAILVGASPIITSSSDEKLQKAQAMGAHGVINYLQNERWEESVLEMTEGAGVDHVVEVGGAGTLARSLRAVRPDGQVSLIGVLAGVGGEINLLPVLMKNIRVQGIFAGHRASFEEMNRAFSLHKIQPVVDRIYPFGEAASALKEMKSGSHFGKICLDISK